MNCSISHSHCQIQIVGLGTEADPEESWTACHSLPAINSKMPSEPVQKPAVLQTDLHFNFSSPPPISMV